MGVETSTQADTGGNPAGPAYRQVVAPSWHAVSLHGFALWRLQRNGVAQGFLPIAFIEHVEHAAHVSSLAHTEQFGRAGQDRELGDGVIQAPRPRRELRGPGCSAAFAGGRAARRADAGELGQQTQHAERRHPGTGGHCGGDAEATPAAFALQRGGRVAQEGLACCRGRWNGVAQYFAQRLGLLHGAQGDTFPALRRLKRLMHRDVAQIEPDRRIDAFGGVEPAVFRLGIAHYANCALHIGARQRGAFAIGQRRARQHAADFAQGQAVQLPAAAQPSTGIFEHVSVELAIEFRPRFPIAEYASARLFLADQGHIEPKATHLAHAVE